MTEQAIHAQTDVPHLCVVIHADDDKVAGFGHTPQRLRSGTSKIRQSGGDLCPTRVEHQGLSSAEKSTGDRKPHFSQPDHSDRRVSHGSLRSGIAYTRIESDDPGTHSVPLVAFVYEPNHLYGTCDSSLRQLTNEPAPLRGFAGRSTTTR